MAIYHCRVKVVSRSSGRSIISASAYRNASKMKDNETGLTYDYSRKRNVVDSEILYCENAPEEWKVVPDEAIEEFKKTAKYKKAPDKEAVIEWFNVRYQKERLWNEVITAENYSNARLAREFELAIPYECSKEESRKLVIDYVQKYLVDDGMCADIVWHNPDKETKNPHAHVLVTMRPILKNGKWAPKETKEYALDENGNKIPVIDPATGLQKIGDRNRKVWKRVTVQKNYWNSEDKLMEWREGWAVECNKYLSPENHIDHRSNKARGIDKIATVHEGYAARKIEESGQTSWVCELNREIKSANVDYAVMQIQANWTEEKFEKIEKEREEYNNVAARRKERAVNASPGREPDYPETFESVIRATEGDSGTDGRTAERERFLVRTADETEQGGQIDGYNSGIIPCERDVEQRKLAAIKVGRANTGVVNGEDKRPDRGERPVATTGRVSSQAATGIRNRIATSGRGLPESNGRIASRFRRVFGERISRAAEKIGKQIEEALLILKNRMAQLKELAANHYGVSPDKINITDDEQENPEGQANNMKRRKGR